MNRLMGIETEYGIALDQEKESDPVAESIALIHCYRPDDPAPRWDYSREDPFRDAQGGRAAVLHEHPDEKKEQKRDAKRALSFEQVKSDRILFNGARLYNDHAHPEYSTPECRSLFDLVAHDKAGERILLQCARRRTEQLGVRCLLYKNNTDFRGHSYGCHDNYLMSREVPFRYVRESLLAFNATRQIYAGAGKIGIETERGLKTPGHYQISQRADFFQVKASVDTMHKRPLVNTRDEPHADPSKYRRLHGIAGDANMSEYATALKVGTTALVVDLIEQRAVPETLRLTNPVGAARRISRNAEGDWRVRMADGSRSNAVEVQRAYLRLAEKHTRETGADAEWTLNEWTRVLDALERDPMELRRELDWVAKKWALTVFVEEEGLEWDDPWLRSLDLEYHNIDMDEGIFYELQAAGEMRRAASDAAVEEAAFSPPSDTRAYVRGRALERFGAQVQAAQWGALTFEIEGQKAELDLTPLAEHDEAARHIQALDASETAGDFLRAAGLL